MKVYLVMGNDQPECVLAHKDAAEEYVTYRKEVEARRKGRKKINWRYYEFNLFYGQYR